MYEERFARRSVSGYFRYLALRLGRIYPVHLATLLLMLLLFALLRSLGRIESPLWSYSPADLALNLALLQGWDLTHDLTFNRPAWSVSAEWFAYLWFPLASPWVRRIGGGARAALLALACWGAMLATLRLLGEHDLNRTYHLGLVRVSFELAAGMLLYRSYLSLLERKRLARRVLGAGVIMLALLCATRWLDPLAVPAMGAILLGSAAVDEELGWLAREPLQWLGELSYSLYMVHHLVIRAGSEFIPARGYESAPWPLKPLIPMAYLAAFIALASLIRRWVEEPCRKRARAWVGDGPVATPVAFANPH